MSFTQIVLSFATRRFEDGLLLSVSTNLSNLGTHPVSAIFGSVFFVTSGRVYLVFLAACLLIIAPLERRIGSQRILAGAAIGHVGSTLAIAAGLWAATPWQSSAGAIDVGPSYGVRFLVAGATCQLRGWSRWLAAATLLCGSLGQALVFGSYTDWGHFVAIASGLALGPLILTIRPISTA